MKLNQKAKKTEKTMIDKAHRLQNRKNREIVFNGMLLGAFGRQVCVPVILGIILGRFLDAHMMVAHISWTFNCIILGFCVGLYQVYNWLKKNGYLNKKESE